MQASLPHRHRRPMPAAPLAAAARAKPLLACGVVAAAISFTTDLTAGATWPGYNFVTESASVLTVPGTPSRPFVVALQLAANVLVVAFAYGLWLASGRRRSLKAIAVLVALSAGLQSIAVTVFPFNPDRGTGEFVNTANVVLMAPSIGAWFLAIGLGAFAFRNWFRYLSIGLLLALLVEDVVATAGASLLVAGGHAGSLVGLQERSMGYGFWAWVAALALVQLNALRTGSRA